MALVPTNKSERIGFYEAHIEQWTTNALAIGVTVAECTAMDALITTARKDLTGQDIAADAAQVATVVCNTSVRAMHAKGAGMIAKIKAFAEATNNPNVFNLAGIPGPAVESPMPPPGVARDFVATLNQTGFLTLKWKCTNPAGANGTAYEVQRKVGNGNFAFIGIAGGNKEFIDTTLTAGSTGVVYQITGVRSSLRGPAAQVNVNFGVGGGGGGFTVTSVTEGTNVTAKLAA